MYFSISHGKGRGKGRIPDICNTRTHTRTHLYFNLGAFSMLISLLKYIQRNGFLTKNCTNHWPKGNEDTIMTFLSNLKYYCSF